MSKPPQPVGRAALAAAAALWASFIFAGWQAGMLPGHTALIAALPLAVAAAAYTTRLLIRLIYSPHCRLTIGAWVQWLPAGPDAVPVDTTKQSTITFQTRRRRAGDIRVIHEESGAITLRIEVSGYAGRPSAINRSLRRECLRLLETMARTAPDTPTRLWLRVDIPNPSPQHHRNIIRQFGIEPLSNTTMTSLELDATQKIGEHDVHVQVHKDGFHLYANDPAAMVEAARMHLEKLQPA